jgi:hypothetical protein
MLLSFSNKGLEDFIVEIVGEGQTVSARQIRERLIERGEDVGASLQSIYQALEKLITGGAVIKYGKLYTLNSVWLRSLMSFAQKSVLAPIASDELKRLFILGKPIGKDEWKWDFPSLGGAHVFWMNLALAVQASSGYADIVSWSPTPVDRFIPQGPRLQFLKISQLMGAGRIFRLDRESDYGYEDPADKALEGRFVRKYAPDLPPRSFPGHFLDVYSQNIMTITIDPFLEDWMSSTHADLSQGKLPSIKRFVQIYQAKAKCSVSLCRNEDKAREIYRSFSKIFNENIVMRYESPTKVVNQ